MNYNWVLLILIGEVLYMLELNYNFYNMGNIYEKLDRELYNVVVSFIIQTCLTNPNMKLNLIMCLLIFNFIIQL